VAINDLGPVETNAHLLRYDSVHGRSRQKSGQRRHDLRRRRQADQGDRRSAIRRTCPGANSASTSPWSAPASSPPRKRLPAPGSRRQARAGLRSGRGADKTIVYGVNHDKLTKDDLVVSNASCTTNCLAPVAYVLNEAVGIEKGFMTTIHSYTGDQPTLDTMHKDLYRARAAAMSMIPTSTGAAKAVGLVLPELNGKLDGVAIRVPTPNVSVVDLKFIARRETTVEEINNAIRAAADGELKGILGYTDDKLVSIDFNHDRHSSTFHTDQTKVMDGTFVRILSWYDNEWGFSNRMADTAAMDCIGGKLI
jgi:glyceraldehyde 3-phosphate dehydrogenase